jgi:hypothetical protein
MANLRQEDGVTAAKHHLCICEGCLHKDLEVLDQRPLGAPPGFWPSGSQSPCQVSKEIRLQQEARFPRKFSARKILPSQKPRENKSQSLIAVFQRLRSLPSWQSRRGELKRSSPCFCKSQDTPLPSSNPRPTNWRTELSGHSPDGTSPISS